MKKFFLLAILIIFSAGNGLAQVEERIVEEVIVKINDDMITLTDFQSLYVPISQRMDQGYQGSDLEEKKQEVEKKIFNLLVNKKVMRVRFEERGFTFNDEVYQRAYSYFMQSTGAKNMEELEQALADNNMSMESLRTFAEENYIEQILFRTEVMQQQEVTESRIQEYYEAHDDRYTTEERVSISQIVVTFTEVDKQIKKAVAEEALEKVRAGEDFDVVYRNVTPGAGIDDSASIGEIEADSLRPELTEAISELEVGEISDIIELNSVFVILRVDDRVPAEVIPLEQIRNRVEEDILQEVFNEGLDQLLKQYKQNLFIDIKSPRFQELYDPESTIRNIQRIFQS